MSKLLAFMWVALCFGSPSLWINKVHFHYILLPGRLMVRNVFMITMHVTIDIADLLIAVVTVVFSGEVRASASCLLRQEQSRRERHLRRVHQLHVLARVLVPVWDLLNHHKLHCRWRMAAIFAPLQQYVYFCIMLILFYGCCNKVV